MCLSQHQGLLSEHRSQTCSCQSCSQAEKGRATLPAPRGHVQGESERPNPEEDLHPCHTRGLSPAALTPPAPPARAASDRTTNGQGACPAGNGSGRGRRGGEGAGPRQRGGSRRVAALISGPACPSAVSVMAWGCALCLALAGGVFLILLVQLLRWLRADGDLTLLWAEWQGKKPGKAVSQQPPGAWRGPGVGRGGGSVATREGRGNGGLWGGEERGPQRWG